MSSTRAPTARQAEAEVADRRRQVATLDRAALAERILGGEAAAERQRRVDETSERLRRAAAEFGFAVSADLRVGERDAAKLLSLSTCLKSPIIKNRR